MNILPYTKCIRCDMLKLSDEYFEFYFLVTVFLKYLKKIFSTTTLQMSLF